MTLLGNSLLSSLIDLSSLCNNTFYLCYFFFFLFLLSIVEIWWHVDVNVFRLTLPALCVYKLKFHINTFLGGGAARRKQFQAHCTCALLVLFRMYRKLFEKDSFPSWKTERKSNVKFYLFKVRFKCWKM